MVTENRLKAKEWFATGLNLPAQGSHRCIEAAVVPGRLLERLLRGFFVAGQGAGISVEKKNVSAKAGVNRSLELQNLAQAMVRVRSTAKLEIAFGQREEDFAGRDLAR
jgi:hypothetical protein